MAPSMSRPAVALLLPPAERDPVAAELHAGGFDPVPLDDVRDLAALMATRTDVAVGIIDAEVEPEQRNARLVAAPGQRPADPGPADRQPGHDGHPGHGRPGHEDDEYLTRPYSAESIRWRVEAMCIRAVAVDDGSGPVLQGELGHGRLEPTRPADRGLQPQGRRRQDDHRHQPRRDARGARASACCSSTPTP